MTSIIFREGDKPHAQKLRYGAAAAAVLLSWFALYRWAEPASSLIVFELLGLSPASRTGAALQFFLYDSTKILLLLVLMIYLISLLRAGLNPDRVRAILAGRSRLPGYGLGALFGAITPFCSCSSVPLFIGFTAGGIPFGITMAFLITSPVINEMAVVLLWELLGWKLTLLYVATGLLIGILGGLFVDAIHAGRWLQPFLLQSFDADASGQAVHGNPSLGLQARHAFALSETRDILRRVAKWVFIGVGAAAFIHGWVPEGWLLEHFSSDRLWSVPAAVLVGLPLYTNVTGIVPVMENLLLKGLPLGTTLAFCISGVAASLPELIMLRQVMTDRLITVFLGFLLVAITAAGWLLNLLAPMLK